MAAWWADGAPHRLRAHLQPPGRGLRAGDRRRHRPVAVVRGTGPRAARPRRGRAQRGRRQLLDGDLNGGHQARARRPWRLGRHMPVETTDLFVPFLRDNGFEVSVSDSTAVYADESVMADVDLIVQVVTMSTIADDEFAGLQRAVSAVPGSRGGTVGIADAFRNTADYLHMVGGSSPTTPANTRRSASASSRQLHPVHGAHHRGRARAPRHAGHRGLRPRDRAVLGALRRVTTTCWRPPRRRHGLRRLEPTRDRARDLDPAVGRGPRVRLGARARLEVVESRATPHDHREGSAVGSPLKGRRHRRRQHQSAVLRALPACRGSP